MKKSSGDLSLLLALKLLLCSTDVLKKIPHGHRKASVRPRENGLPSVVSLLLLPSVFVFTSS